ncbi:DNA cytosine methyltransferase [Priestia aryabhattai]|uniref:DNA cytosine methyltransferase n=1 Tax=Priestia aryabhattai TaxID=412384 RepID=UPI00399FE275
MKTIKMNDFFCGGGGFGLAAKEAGVEVVSAYDWDKYAVQMYKHNVNEHAQQMDITKMTWHDVKKADIWSFGFPCTDLSKARMDERKKLEGEGSGMFYEVMRLLDEVIENAPENKPDALLVENVYELIEVMDILEEEFNKRGYSINPALYNSKWWGLPQSRERWYVVGIDRKTGKEYQPIQQQENFIVKAKHFLEPKVDKKYVYDIDEYPYELFNSYAKEGGMIQVGKFHTNWLDIMKRIYLTEGILPTLHTCQGGHRQVKIVDPYTFRVRKGTPREYARAQGFPEDYEIIVSDSQAYKIFGNAVSVPLAAEHLRNVKMFLLSL